MVHFSWFCFCLFYNDAEKIRKLLNSRFDGKPFLTSKADRDAHESSLKNTFTDGGEFAFMRAFFNKKSTLSEYERESLEEHFSSYITELKENLEKNDVYENKSDYFKMFDKFVYATSDDEWGWLFKESAEYYCKKFELQDASLDGYQLVIFVRPESNEWHLCSEPQINDDDISEDLFAKQLQIYNYTEEEEEEKSSDEEE